MIKKIILLLIVSCGLLVSYDTPWSPDRVTNADAINKTAIKKASIIKYAPVSIRNRIANSHAISELNNPTTTVFDITKDPTDFASVISKTMHEVDRIAVSIAKITSIFPRDITTYDCLTGLYGNIVCPEHMQPAVSYFTYNDGTSEEKIDTVIDFENGTHSEHTAYVWDYVSKIGGTQEVATTTAKVYIDYVLKNLTATECGKYRFGDEVLECTYLWDDWGYALKCRHSNYTWDRFGEYSDYCYFGDYWERICGGAKYAYHHGPEYTRACFNNKECPSGYSADGSRCSKEITACPAGTTPIYEHAVGNDGHGYGWNYFWIKACSKSILICPSGNIDNGSNCKHKTSYSYYSYGCSAGYSTTNHGLSTCSKTDSDGTINNEATLNDDCNSPTPPVGNCSKTVTYKYYKYLCDNAASNQGTKYIAIDAGLSSTCSKIDQNNNIISPELANNCNSPTPPSNNCREIHYKCSDLKEPTFINDTWYCSSYICDSNKKCATAKCINGKPQPGGTSFDFSPFLSINTTTICNDDPICDAILYKKLGRCGKPPRCPTAFGVYNQNGNCYQDVCPPNSTENADGKCMVK